MSFPRYPTYKKSDAGWMFDVPEHWKLMPCRGFVDERTEKNEDAACQSYLSLMANVGVIPYEEKGDIGNKKPDDLSKCKIVHQGDFVINSMNYGIGSYGVSAYEGVCSPVYIILRPKSDVVEPGFAFRVFEDKSFQAFAQSFGNGILAHRCSIGWDDLKGIAVGIPPAEEQKSILTFLDHETAKIDALIAEQERLIELLQEKRQAVISHAATKGINPYAPMKDTGVEWLGEVPEHWRVSEARREIEYLTSGSRGWADFYSDEGPIFLRIANLTRDKIELKLDNIQRVSPPIGAEGARTEVKSGDVLFSITAYLGSVAVVPTNLEKAYVSQHVCLARLNRLNLSPKWLAYSVLSSSGKAYLEANSYGGTKVQLGLDDIKSFPLAFPSLQEQEEIIKKLEESLRRLDELKSKAIENIDLLQERRSALVSAAVTGQIDVRGLVPQEAAT